MKQKKQMLMQEERPTYFIDGSGGFRWMCSFCDYVENGKLNYGRIGYKCPKCAAVFVSCSSVCQQQDVLKTFHPACWA